MKKPAFVLISLVASFATSVLWAEGKYPPLSEYMMAPDAEAGLARSAAPDRISERATIKILTASGYKVASKGDNGFVCMVLRGWGVPAFMLTPSRELAYFSKLRAPICFDPVASRTILPLQELRAELGMQGKDPDAIATAVAMAYAFGKCRRWRARPSRTCGRPARCSVPDPGRGTRT